MFGISVAVENTGCTEVTAFTVAAKSADAAFVMVLRGLMPAW